MEFVDNLFGFKKARQEGLLRKLGVAVELKKELIGSESEQVSVVQVDNDQFLEILKSGKQDRVLSHMVNQSDTHQYHELYLDVGEELKVKTGVTAIDYSHERTLFSDLQEMFFILDPDESKGGWGVYKRQSKSDE